MPKTDKKVLCVEDNPVNMLLVSRIVEAEGHELIKATDATAAQVLVGDRERCLEAGCDDYLPKPLDIRKLREVLRTYLSNGNGAA